jgi:hypothetical protein
MLFLLTFLLWTASFLARDFFRFFELFDVIKDD